MTPLETAIEMGRAAGKKALYFGCWQRPGHYLHRVGGATVYDPRETLPGFPWTMGLLDGGLLKNGGRSDVYDGRVFWTCGGSSFWYAFFWWDNSVDRRRVLRPRIRLARGAGGVRLRVRPVPGHRRAAAAAARPAGGASPRPSPGSTIRMTTSRA